MSRTSTTLKPKCGKAGIEPSNSFLTASSDAEKSDPRTGPRTRPGLTVTSSSAPPSALCHAHAARSAIVFARSYGDVSLRFVSSVQSAYLRGSSRTPRPNIIAEIEEVMTTRFTPASRAALSTRRVPSRAGRTSSSSDFGSTVGTGDATWST